MDNIVKNSKGNKKPGNKVKLNISSTAINASRLRSFVKNKNSKQRLMDMDNRLVVTRG